MSKKYINLLLLPVIFILTSCTGTAKKSDPLADFTSSIEDVAEIFSFSEKELESEQEQEAVKGDEKQAADKLEESVAEEKKPMKKKQKLNQEFNEFSSKYHLGYLTFDVANFYSELKKLKSDDEADYFKISFYAKTNGFVDYLFGWLSYTASYFKVVDNEIIPTKFKTKVLFKKKTREIEIKYDENGEIAFEKVTPPDNRQKRPAVPKNLKKGIFDPLTIIIQARKMIKQAVVEDNFNDRGIYKFTLPLYDARKRTDINFFLYERKVAGLYKLEIRRKPISGYTNNDLKKAKKHQVKIEVFIDPKTMLPVKANGISLIGTAKAGYVGECKSGIKKCVK